MVTLWEMWDPGWMLLFTSEGSLFRTCAGVNTPGQKSHIREPRATREGARPKGKRG